MSASSPAAAPSQYAFSPIQYPLSIRPFFGATKRSNYREIPRRQLILSKSKLACSAIDTIVPAETPLKSNPNFDCGNVSFYTEESFHFPDKFDAFLFVSEPKSLRLNGRRLRVESLAERIRAMPSKSRSQVLSFFKGDGDLKTISDLNDLLMALVIAREPDVAIGLFSNIPSFGMVPNCGSYSIMIRCYCEKNDLEKARAVLDHMLEIGFKPSVATVTTIINFLCRKGRVKKAFEILDLINKIGCKPTIQTYNCLLKGLCYVGKVEEAYEILIGLKKTALQPDIFTYTTVMDGFCKVGRSDEARELLDEVKEMGLTPNVVTFNTLFEGYAREGRPAKGIGVLKQMKRSNCSPNFISYSTLLHGLLKWDHVRSARRVYKEMMHSGFEADERTMNSLLRGLCKQSCKETDLLEDANQVFDKMKKNRSSFIDQKAYGLMIQSLCVGKRVVEAWNNLKDMIGMGYSPGSVVFDKVLQTLCSEGMVVEAILALVLMHENRKVPSRYSYNLLIDEFSRQGMSKAACSLYGAALKSGMVPNTKPPCESDILMHQNFLFRTKN